MSTKRILLCSVAVGLALPALPVAAQQQVEEVIVTARKREESILNVPVVATVLSQKALEEANTDDLFSLKSYVPGLLMGTSTNSVGTQVSLRGVGSTAQNATMDQSISLNIDGLALGQGVAYQAGMFDVGQVEVLKGPQALFYGKNSPGGVISLRSADPTSEVEIIARAGYEFEAREKVGELILSGPVSDSLKARLAVKYSDSDGYFYNKAVAAPGWGTLNPPSDRLARSKNWILRGTLLWEPIDNYSARLKLNYTNEDTNGNTSGTQVVSCPDGTGPVPGTNIPFMVGEDCKLDRAYRHPYPDLAFYPSASIVPNNGKYFTKATQAFGTLEQNLGITDDLTFTSVSAVYVNEYQSLMHGSSTPSIQPFVQTQHFKNRQITQEFRLTSDFAESPLNFMAGAFYQYGRQTNHVLVLTNRLMGPLPPTLMNVHHQIKIDSLSLFGQGIWDVTDQLEIAAGARWTKEERDHVMTNYYIGNGPIGRIFRPDPSIGADNISPEVSVTYKPTTDLTLFGSYKQGFKSGSYNSSNFQSPTVIASFDDEKVKGGEFGLKSRLLDRTLSFNAAAYYYKYSDLQVGALELSEQPGTSGTINRTYINRTLNAAAAVVKGIELDATYDPVQIDGLTIRGSLNYNRARYTDFTNAPCGNGQTIAQGCNQLFNASLNKYGAQDLSGKPLVRAPDWAATLGFDYVKPVGNNGMTVAIGANANYTSKYSTTLVNLPGFDQKAFYKVNASIALRGRDDAWELALIGNNIGDKLTRGLCFNSNVQNGTLLGGQISGTAMAGPAGGDEATCAIDRGREVWVRFTVRPSEWMRNR